MIAFLRKVKKVFTEKIQSAKVYLYEEDYINIRDGVSHSVPHPEIETDFDKVEKAIENPNFVSEDPDYKRKCYYLSFSGRGEDWNIYYNKKADMITMGANFPAGTFYYCVDDGAMIRIDENNKIYGFAIENAK